MVFGNSGTHAGSGVGFTRNPTNGDKHLWIDFLLNAQGEDVVSGRRNAHGAEAMSNLIPDAWLQLQKYTHALEIEFSDMQDFEFTVEDGQLYMLQTRSGKRTAIAEAQIALDLLDEGVIDKRTAKERTSHLTQDDLIHQVLASEDDASAHATPIASAMSACSGIVSGEIAFDEARAKERNTAGAEVILIRQDAETNDIAALEFSVGLLTARGARTSHAAVVARQLGKVCLVGCQYLTINQAQRSMTIGEASLFEGDMLTLDGNEGHIYAGRLSVVNQPDTALFERLKMIRHGAKHD
jgi:pyruvate,orthophosphate dikinase